MRSFFKRTRYRRPGPRSLPDQSSSHRLNLEPLEDRRLLFASSVHSILGLTHIGGLIHQEINADSLGFLSDDILQRLDQRTVAQDDFTLLPPAGPQFEAAFHFDSSHFQEGVSYINSEYDAILAAYGSNSPDRFDTIADHFGNILHAAQDFYSHTNWVESGETGLVDSGLGEWTQIVPFKPVGNLVFAEHAGSLPVGWKLANPAERTSGLVFHLVNSTAYPGQTFLGIVSGDVGVAGTGITYPYQASQTPNELARSHGGIAGSGEPEPNLAKDEPGEGQFQDAYNLAVRQTQHELFRLVSLIQTHFGSADPLLSNWSAQASNNASLRALQALGGQDAMFLGRTGDVIPVDLHQSAPGTTKIVLPTNAFQVIDSSGVAKTVQVTPNSLRGDWTLSADGQLLGYVVFSNRVDSGASSFASSGRFYFAQPRRTMLLVTSIPATMAFKVNCESISRLIRQTRPRDCLSCRVSAQLEKPRSAWKLHRSIQCGCNSAWIIWALRTMREKH